MEGQSYQHLATKSLQDDEKGKGGGGGGREGGRNLWGEKDVSCCFQSDFLNLFPRKDNTLTSRILQQWYCHRLGPDMTCLGLSIQLN